MAVVDKWKRKRPMSFPKLLDGKSHEVKEKCEGEFVKIPERTASVHLQ